MRRKSTYFSAAHPTGEKKRKYFTNSPKIVKIGKKGKKVKLGDLGMKICICAVVSFFGFSLSENPQAMAQNWHMQTHRIWLTNMTADVPIRWHLSHAKYQRSVFTLPHYRAEFDHLPKGQWVLSAFDTITGKLLEVRNFTLESNRRFTFTGQAGKINFSDPDEN